MTPPKQTTEEYQLNEWLGLYREKHPSIILRALWGSIAVIVSLTIVGLPIGFLIYGWLKGLTARHQRWLDLSEDNHCWRCGR